MLDGYLIARIGLAVVGLAVVSLGLTKTISGRLVSRPWSGQVFRQDQAAFSSLPPQRIRTHGVGDALAGAAFISMSTFTAYGVIFFVMLMVAAMAVVAFDATRHGLVSGWPRRLGFVVAITVLSYGGAAAFVLIRNGLK